MSHNFPTLRNSLAALVALSAISLILVGCNKKDPNVVEAPKVKESTGSIESSPFVANDAEPAKAGFTSLDPAETGLDFVHIWNEDTKYKRELETQFAGGGVAIGDYNDDGWTDVYMSRPFEGGRLYKNLGGMKFEDVTEATGLDSDKTYWGTGCSFVDINNDGALDLFVCGYDCPNRLFINNDGQFTEQAAEYGLDVTGATVMASFSDYDNDGDMDVFLVKYRYSPPGKPVVSRARFSEMFKQYGFDMPKEVLAQWTIISDDLKNPRVVMSGQECELFQNDGNGKFEDVTAKAGVKEYGMTLSATWWDYNHDGRPDLYVANDFYGPDYLYHNNGDGTFKDVLRDVLPHVPWFSMGADVSDINNDGLLDFMAADMSGTTHYKQKVSMGEMTTNAWFLDSSDPSQYMRNAVYLNTGTDRFMEGAHMLGLSNSDWTWAVKFGDLDCDGWNDLFITNGMTGDQLNSDAQGKRSDKIELKRDPNLAFKNNGGLKFENVSHDWGLHLESVSFGAAYGDLDNDGDLDIVVNSFQEPARLYQNDLADGHQIKVRLKGVVSNSHGVGALVRIKTDDWVQAKYLTLAHGFMSSDEPVLHFGLGEFEKVNEMTIEWPSGYKQKLTDVEADQLYTITESTMEKDVKSLLESADPMFAYDKKNRLPRHAENKFDDFGVQPLLPNKSSQLGPGMAMGDVDGDGDEDLFLGGASTGFGDNKVAGSKLLRGRISLNDKGRFKTVALADSKDPFLADENSEDMGALFFDAEGDGDLDLYVVSGGVECEAGAKVLQDRLYLNDGTGAFTKASVDALPEIRESGSCVVGSDFDRDGDIDLFVGGRIIPGKYPETPKSFLLRNDSSDGAAKFTDVTEELGAELSLTGLVTGAIWSDVNGDGWVDLLVTHEWGPVKLFSNQEGKLTEATEDAGLAERLGWWNGISAGDIDSDGDIDYLVTNFGLNTKYHPTVEKPVAIYYADFDESGQCQIVEAKKTSDGYLPVRGKSCSQHAMPFIEKKLPTYHEFAMSSLSDIYTEDSLDQALQVIVNDLHHGVLLNDGSGKFEFQELPRVSQIAPGFSSLLADINGDGHLDAFMTQNFFGPQRETGKFDGGLSQLMLGDGSGELTPVVPAESGFVIHTDATSAISADIDEDGKPDMLVGINNEPARFYANKTQGKFRKLQLKSANGNANAIGASIKVKLADGSVQAHEVYAGHGYLSQGPASIMLGGETAIESVEVRWPNGKVSTHEVSGSEAISIAQPE